jgi:hypothetical protein
MRTGFNTPPVKKKDSLFSFMDLLLATQQKGLPMNIYLTMKVTLICLLISQENHSEGKRSRRSSHCSAALP